MISTERRAPVMLAPFLLQTILNQSLTRSKTDAY